MSQIAQPTVLNLRAINQIWHLKYMPTQSATLRYAVSPGVEYNTLTLYGNVNNQQRVRLFLHKWLKDIANEHLLPWLQRLSFEFKMPFNKATFRAQRTLWGSCTSKKNISLNYKLLFLPPEYARHVMLHELCHTKHLNHSARFWSLLAKVDANYREYDKVLRNADAAYVPELVMA